MSTDLSDHVGQWIAISDEKIIIADKSVKKVIEEAKKLRPKRRPFIAKVPEKLAMIF